MEDTRKLVVSAQLPPCWLGSGSGLCGFCGFAILSRPANWVRASGWFSLPFLQRSAGISDVCLHSRLCKWVVGMDSGQQVCIASALFLWSHLPGRGPSFFGGWGKRTLGAQIQGQLGNMMGPCFKKQNKNKTKKRTKSPTAYQRIILALQNQTLPGPQNMLKDEKIKHKANTVKQLPSDGHRTAKIFPSTPRARNICFCSCFLMV